MGRQTYTQSGRKRKRQTKELDGHEGKQEKYIDRELRMQARVQARRRKDRKTNKQ